MHEHDEGFEERVRAIAREISESAERMAQLDLDEIAESIGIDPSRARGWVESAGSWLRAQAESFEDLRSQSPWQEPAAPPESAWHEPPESARHRHPVSREEPLPSAAPHPLDQPTEEQALALAALESGRWTIEPGSGALAAQGDGPGPSHALGIVRELRVRDWIAADGELTLAGRSALTRWLEAAARR